MTFSDLGEVVLDENFPAVDMALRRGRHVHKDDERWYAFLTEAHSLLDDFYRRYGCELVQRSDGYFFLLPQSDELGKRHLSIAEMIVGQGLALAYLDPHSVEKGGVIGRDDLLGQLAAVMGTDALMRTLNPKRKRVDERVMQRTVRQKVNDALRRLEQLGFVELLEGERLRLPPSLLRFAEPVRGLEAPSEALAKLLERGEISLEPSDDAGHDDDVHNDGARDDGAGEESADASADDDDDDHAVDDDDGEPAPGENAVAHGADEEDVDRHPPNLSPNGAAHGATPTRASLEELAAEFDDIDWDTPSEET